MMGKSAIELFMSITLSPEQERFIQEKLNSGQYQNAEQIIHEAFQLLEKWEQYQQWTKETREKVQVGLAELERGEGMDSEEVIAQMRSSLSLEKARSKTS